MQKQLVRFKHRFHDKITINTSQHIFPNRILIFKHQIPFEGENLACLFSQTCTDMAISKEHAQLLSYVGIFQLLREMDIVITNHWPQRDFISQK